MNTRELAASLLHPLAAASAIGIGFATGGLFGQNVIAGIGVSLSSTLTDQLLGGLRKRFAESGSGLLNHDLQQVLARGFVHALDQIERDYFATPEGRSLPRLKQDLIRELFKELRRDEHAFLAAIDTNVEEIRTYLYGGQDEATHLLHERFGPPLRTFPPGFRRFVEERLLKDVLFFFGEELKKDLPLSNRAWRAFQRLLLEGIRSSQLDLLANQQAMQEELKKLDGVEARLDALADHLDRRRPDDEEPFLNGLNSAVDEVGRELEALRELTQNLYERVQDSHELLEEMAAFMGVRRRKKCFVTGPPERLERLVETVVAPVLQAYAYDVATSDARVERGDLRLLENADLVIADLTGSDFQVVYELTLSHCLGRPDITLIDPEAGYGREDLPPDTLLVDLDRPDEARAHLERAVARVAQVAATNPVTRFFKAPLTEVSPAYGLALGYSTNMLWRAAPVVRALRRGAPGYVETGGMRITAPERLRTLRLRVLVPPELDAAEKGNVEALYARHAWPVAAFGLDGAPPVLARLALLPYPEPDLVLADVPTTMSVIADAIAARLGTDEQTDAWRIHEGREIAHFVRSLMRLVDRRRDGIHPLQDGLLDIVPLNRELDR